MVEETIHFAPKYFGNPTHPLSVLVIGAGGNGNQVVNQLARMHIALVGLGHVGLHVTVMDNDIVEQSNLGRQNFSPSDLKRYKGEVLIDRINRFHQLNWEFKNYQLTTQNIHELSENIIISCVDNINARKVIWSFIKNIRGKITKRTVFDHRLPLYWMDFGNKKDFGQAILGTTIKIPQPESKFKTADYLNPIFKVHGKMLTIKDSPHEPSCSTFEALLQQDLFVNSALVQFGMMILWELLSKLQIRYHGVYVNTKNLTVKPLPI